MDGLRLQRKPAKSLVLILALLSVHLVSELTLARSIKDELPALILDDEQPSVTKESVASSAATEALENTSVARSSVQETSPAPQAERTDAKQEPSTESTSANSSPTITSDPLVSAREPTTSQPSERPEPASSQASPKASSSNDAKDINVLLANKDDAENDLSSIAASPSETDNPSNPAIGLDSPVETKKPSESNDDRFHYALSGEKFGEDSKPADPEVKVASAQPTTTTTTTGAATESPITTTEKPLIKDKKKDEEEPAKSNNSGDDDKLDGKPEIESPKIPESPLDSRDDKPTRTTDETKNSSSSESSAEKEPAKPAADSSIATAEVPTSSSSPSIPSTTTAAPEEKPKKKSPEAPLAEPGKRSESSAPAAKPEPEKPSSFPTVLATALGTVIGNAIAPAIASKDQKPPVVAASPPAAAASPSQPGSSAPSSTTTTKAPSSTRKSSIDKWDRWNPTGSTSPPSRRRPILPSIRRRFRPYNRFSPFPWGVDNYTPFGGDLDFMQPESGPKPPPSDKAASPTLKPRRRGSSTTESTRHGADFESDERVDEYENRRRGQGSNKRRNHHRHHGAHDGYEPTRRRHHSPGHRHVEDRYPESAPFEPDFSNHPRPPSPGFGLFNTGSTGSTGSTGYTGSGFDLLDPLSGWSDGVTKPRPPSGSAAAPRPPGSGRPGSSYGPSGGKPDYNDETPSGSPHSHEHGHNHRHHHGHHHGHNQRDTVTVIENDNHGHHCHDDDYDHDHDWHHRDPTRPPRDPYRPSGGDPYRPSGSEPYRPPRDPYRPPRDPYRPESEYDEYSGRRPNRPSRPHRPRTGSDDTRNERNEASPSLYNPTISSPSAASPVEPKRLPSIFSPFESLFSSIDEDLFSLRSSFVDPSPPHAFDAIISSPKIKLPVSADKPAAGPAGNDRLKESRGSVEDANGKDSFETESGDKFDDKDEAEISSLASGRSAILARSAIRRPCAFPDGSLICLFMSRSSPLLELFQRI